MKVEKLKELLREFGENVKFNYELKKNTWFNIGGQTKVFYKAKNLKELVNFLQKINREEKIFVIGVTEITFD